MNISQIAILGVFLILFDSLYYTFTSQIYIKKIEEIQQRPFTFRIYGAIVRYSILIVGLSYFILNKNGSLLDAFLLAILLNGAFNGTMYASFSNWNAIGALLDTLWFGILFVATVYITRKFTYSDKS